MSERRALAGAGAAHLALLAALSLGWTAMQKPQPAPDAVAVDLVDISDMPKASAEARKASAPPAAAPVPLPAPAVRRVDPAPSPTLPPSGGGTAAQPQREGKPVADDVPAPAVKPKPAPRPKPAPTPDQLTRALDRSLAPASKAVPKPRTDPAQLAALLDRSLAPAPKAKPKPRADPAQLAALLDRTLGKAPAAPRAKPGPQQTAQPANAQLSPLAMATLSQAIAGKIARCWSILPGQQSMTVDLNVRLARDGSLAGPITVVGVTGGANAAAERSFADSARRAVVACAPLHDLPPQSYALWRELSPLHLDAKDVK